MGPAEFCDGRRAIVVKARWATGHLVKSLQIGAQHANAVSIAQ
jgi:hypothetical protein